MARVKMIEVTEASGKVREVFEDIKKHFGMVPNLFKTYALKPEILEANWNKVKAVMMQGELNRELKEMVAVVVSRANGCNYCVRAHSAALKMLGIPKETIIQIIENIDDANIPAELKKVLTFAVKATREPNNISEAELNEIKALGYSDAQIVELLSVVDLYTSFNKFLDTLQVEIDFPRI
ncbi:carboxymuconolactone decarboxylase family protein [Carboxydothermus pertinax]|uniref:Peroxidase n=1 Tax=Carboxydothermus pertinax TaxID=870242 RepID=A0A1L8CWD2_9THEO|nr:peroxidase-related enzyme [Carboxydothermus pertinax]GAV23255.1 peroxidase [Carboxydothermus pertinax]